MAWQVKYSAAALKALAQLDPPVQRRILSFADSRITDDPRRTGKAMQGDQYAWRYRVGDYRLVCDIQEVSRTVVIVRIGHRREIYR